MALKDIREYITALEEHGELRKVSKEVDWDLEVGAIIRLINEKSLPSPLFQKIKGYSPEYTIFGAPINTYKKLAIALGLNPEISQREIMNVYRQRKEKPIKPVIVDKSEAPCKENILKGDDVNLLKFPAPMIHDGDGGRYLGSWHINITKDPDSGWVNWGMYREMIRNKDTLVGSLEPSKHIGYHFYRKYKPKKLPMPFAIVIGPDPISGFMASAPVSANISEVDIAGALRGEPVELVKCETVDLEVPATSEIVIEGEVSPTETQWEGPFGEFSGYSATPREKRPVLKVKAITHRNNPILTVSNMGTPIDESDVALCLVRPGEIFDKLQAEGIPVIDVNMPLGCIGFMIVVSINARGARVPNIADRVSHCVWGSRVGANLPYLFVVEDDVDASDIWQVLHAMVTKCHPYRNIRRLEHTTGIPFMPFLSRYERLNRLGAKVMFDCTFPLEWDPMIEIPQKISFESNYPKELRDYVLENWENYNFDKLG